MIKNKKRAGGKLSACSRLDRGRDDRLASGIEKRGCTMKRILSVTIALVACLSTATVTAQQVSVEIKGVRSNKGNILVMAQAAPETEPVYGLVKAAKGTVYVSLEKAPGKEFLLSVFHDENENWELDVDEKHLPAEGYGRENCRMKQDSVVVLKIKLFYPTPQ